MVAGWLMVAGWFSGWLAGWFAGWLAVWLAGCWGWLAAGAGTLAGWHIVARKHFLQFT